MTGYADKRVLCSLHIMSMQKELRPVQKMGKFTVLDRERAQRKKDYLLRQEKKILAKRYMVELNEMKINMQKRMELERRHLQRVKEELEKNCRAEKASMKRLQVEHKVSWSIFLFSKTIKGLFEKMAYNCDSRESQLYSRNVNGLGHSHRLRAFPPS